MSLKLLSTSFPTFEISVIPVCHKSVIFWTSLFWWFLLTCVFISSRSDRRWNISLDKDCIPVFSSMRVSWIWDKTGSLDWSAGKFVSDSGVTGNFSVNISSWWLDAPSGRAILAFNSFGWERLASLLRLSIFATSVLQWYTTLAGITVLSCNAGSGERSWEELSPSNGWVKSVFVLLTSSSGTNRDIFRISDIISSARPASDSAAGNVLNTENSSISPAEETSLSEGGSVGAETDETGPWSLS